MTFICTSFNGLSLEWLYEIMRLRQEVFVVEQACAYLDADGQDQASFHLMAFDENEKIIGYVRLLPKGLTYEKYPSIGRVAVALQARGTGAGKLLMKEALKQAGLLFFNVSIKISAQCYLIRFYEHLGFSVVGEEYLEDGIPHIGMVFGQD